MSQKSEGCFEFLSVGADEMHQEAEEHPMPFLIDIFYHFGIMANWN